MNDLKYAKVIVRLGSQGFAVLERKAMDRGLTPREYIEGLERMRLDQQLVCRAVWMNLRSGSGSGSGSGDGWDCIVVRRPDLAGVGSGVTR